MQEAKKPRKVEEQYLQNKGLKLKMKIPVILSLKHHLNISSQATQKFSYGVGHILNDLCANCWFSYVLIYMTKVAGLSESNAGLILLVGQLADALFTLVIGYSSDQTKISWYGKRKFWHGIGACCVLLSFPFVFNLCYACNEMSEVFKLCYYSFFAIIFQFGWAATQISHLALIPEITSKEGQRVELNSIRSGFTFLSGIFVYGVIWLLLGKTNTGQIDQTVSKQFMILTIVILIVGSTFSLIFHVGTTEPRCNDYTVSQDGRTWNIWLRDGRLYKTGVIYLCARLAINVSQSLSPMYLTESLHLDKTSIAYFPLIVLMSGAGTCLLLNRFTRRIGMQLSYMFGSSMIICSSLWLFSISAHNKEQVFGATWLIGSGGSIILVTSLAKTAELIDTDKISSGFVYSAMSFTDKLSTGVVIYIIQSLKPNATPGRTCEDCEVFLKIVQTCVPGASALVGFISIIVLFPSEIQWIKSGQ